MNKHIKTTIMVIFLIILFFLLFRVLVTYVYDTPWQHDNFCELKYNTKERGNEQFFGKFCAEVNIENHTIIKHYYTFKEVINYCGKIDFLNIMEWENKCSKEVNNG